MRERGKEKKYKIGAKVMVLANDASGGGVSGGGDCWDE